MKTIWKYELEITDLQVIKMPYGAKILTVQTQNDKPCIWVETNDDAHLPRNNRVIEIIGTGNPMEVRQRTYIGTFQLHNGGMVFHVYEAFQYPTKLVNP